MGPGLEGEDRRALKKALKYVSVTPQSVLRTHGHLNMNQVSGGIGESLLICSGLRVILWWRRPWRLLAGKLSPALCGLGCWPVHPCVCVFSAQRER